MPALPRRRLLLRALQRRILVLRVLLGDLLGALDLFLLLRALRLGVARRLLDLARVDELSSRRRRTPWPRRSCPRPAGPCSWPWKTLCRKNPRVPAFAGTTLPGSARDPAERAL